MKLQSIAVDKLKEKLSEPHTLDLLQSDLLGIRLRQQIYWTNDKKIKEDPIRSATSNLLSRQGKKVFWLMVGGLMESRLSLSRDIDSKGVSGPIGFSSGGVLDFYILQPYAIDLSETPERILSEHRVDLPVNADKARALLPGTTFQIMGKGVASLAAGVKYAKGIASVALSANEKVAGNFTISFIREKGDSVKIVLSQVTERSKNFGLTAKLGWSIGAGVLIEHDWYKSAEAGLDSLSIDKITGSIPGWPEDKSLTEFIREDGLEKGVKKLSELIKDYSEFYGAIGSKSFQKQRKLTTYRFNLSNAKACKAFENLLHLDEVGTAKIANDSTAGVNRTIYTEDSSVDENFITIGFPGKKIVLASMLSSEREGFLLYDENVQILRESIFEKKYEGIVTGGKTINWEGLDVKLNDRRSALSYWHLLFTNNDKFSTKKEVIRFCRFAKTLGANPADEDKIKEIPWASKLFGTSDDTDIKLNLYFTDDGLQAICNSSKNQIRKHCFDVARELGDVPKGAPWQNYRARILMKQYLELLSDLAEDNDLEKKYLREKYEEWGGGRDLEKDASVLKIAINLIGHLSLMSTSQLGSEIGWEKVFKAIGESAGFNYMIIIAILSRLAGESETLLDYLELKRSESGEVLVMVNEKEDIIGADELFTQTDEQILKASG